MKTKTVKKKVKVKQFDPIGATRSKLKRVASSRTGKKMARRLRAWKTRYFVGLGKLIALRG